MGFPGSSDGKEPAEDPGSIPGLGRSPGGWNGYSLQYSYLGKVHGQDSPRGHKESDMTEQLTLSLYVYI